MGGQHPRLLTTPFFAKHLFILRTLVNWYKRRSILPLRRPRLLKHISKLLAIRHVGWSSLSKWRNNWIPLYAKDLSQCGPMALLNFQSGQTAWLRVLEFFF